MHHDRTNPAGTWRNDAMSNTSMKDVQSIFWVHENGNQHVQPNDGLKAGLLNDNFTTSEIIAMIGSLKKNKSPGLDCIPGEFIKVCRYELLDVITVALNFIIEHRDFPDIWVEGLRLPTKSGRMNDCQILS